MFDNPHESTAGDSLHDATLSARPYAHHACEAIQRAELHLKTALYYLDMAYEQREAVYCRRERIESMESLRWEEIEDDRDTISTCLDDIRDSLGSLAVALKYKLKTEEELSNESRRKTKGESQSKGQGES